MSIDINISEVAKEIINSPYSDELMERLYAAYLERDEDECFDYDLVPKILLESIEKNSVSSAFYALCGATAEGILKKGLFIPDEKERLYDEIEEYDATISYNDHTTETVSCMLNSKTYEVFDFDISDENKNKEISEITIRFCDSDCPVNEKQDIEGTDCKWVFWYDDVKRRNKNG